MLIFSAYSCWWIYSSLWSEQKGNFPSSSIGRSLFVLLASFCTLHCSGCSINREWISAYFADSKCRIADWRNRETAAGGCSGQHPGMPEGKAPFTPLVILTSLYLCYKQSQENTNGYSLDMTNTNRTASLVCVWYDSIMASGLLPMIWWIQIDWQHLLHVSCTQHLLSIIPFPLTDYYPGPSELFTIASWISPIHKNLTWKPF